MSLYGTYKKRCPKRMGIALGEEELNSLFEKESNHPYPYHQTFKTNPLTNRPLSYYNELYDCLSNLNDKGLGNRSHSLDESTFVSSAVNNQENTENDESCLEEPDDSAEPKLLDEIGLTVQKLISQCNELSKARNLDHSLKVSKGTPDSNQIVYEIDLSSFCSKVDKSRTNVNLFVSPNSSKVASSASPQVKELLISLGANSSENLANGTKSGDRLVPGNETDFYYSIDDINSALDTDTSQDPFELFKGRNSLNSGFKSFKSSREVPDQKNLGAENTLPFNFEDKFSEDKYQADVSSCEDFAHLVVNVELSLDSKSSDITTESSELSSSASTKSGSYLLTGNETSFGDERSRKLPFKSAEEKVYSDGQSSVFSTFDGGLSEQSDFKFFNYRKRSSPDLGGDSSASNGVSFCTEDSEANTVAKKFITLEDGRTTVSNSEENTIYSNSNTFDRLSLYSDVEFSHPETNGASCSENGPSKEVTSVCSGGLSAFSIPSDSVFALSEDSRENGTLSEDSPENGALSEDSVAPNSVSTESVSRSEDKAESGVGNYSEDNTVQMDSESEVSVSSDIVAWQRDIFLSVLDDSDEDWIIHNRAEWFSSNDYEGRVYFFEENSNESSWTLPDAPDAGSVNESTGNDKEGTQDTSPPHEPSAKPGKVDGTPEEKGLSRSMKSRSMILLDSKQDELTPLSRNWPQLWNGHMCILQEGALNRTKITENGKRLRKNWASAYVVLTELFLLFFKDAKSFAAMRNGGWKPELCVDLNGALIDRGDKVSSRKNVFIMSTVLGLQVLIQCECSQQANSWLTAIQSAIKNLPSGFDNCSRMIRNSTSPECNSPEGGKKAKIGRSKSVKLKNKDGSIEDLTISVAERQTKIRARLKKFFHRRPTMESLVKKGIWKDEPVFGCFLEQACGADSPRVPLVVQRCIKCIEATEENMKADGLYRASGNLSQVQKIRLQVDQNNMGVLDVEEDVHVLTGALKLFFRELKEPLIPCHLFNKALKASTSHSRKEKLNCFREITKALPTANHDTLKFLLQHLLRVTKYKEFNRMHIPNLAIVFGPTLMWPAQESTNMALDLMQQNLVIECFLVEFDQIFR